MIGFSMMVVWLLWCAVYLALMTVHMRTKRHWVWRYWLSVVTLLWLFVALLLDAAGL